MNSNQPADAAAGTNSRAETAEEAGLGKLALLIFLSGAATGLVAALFRLALQQAGSLRDMLIAEAHGLAAVGFLLVVGATASVSLAAAWLVRRFSPHATGSGIP